METFADINGRLRRIDNHGLPFRRHGGHRSESPLKKAASAATFRKRVRDERVGKPEFVE